MSTSLLCTFGVAELSFGVRTGHVLEVLNEQRVTRVPLAPAGVAGLVNLRGHIITALDLRTNLGSLESRSAGATRSLVVSLAGRPVCLIVDDVGDVVELDDSWFEALPSTLPPQVRRLSRGVFKLPTGLLLELDLERLREILLPSERTHEARVLGERNDANRAISGAATQ